MSEHTKLPWFVGTQNDKLFIINKPPRPSHDDMADIADVSVIAPLNACNDAANAAFIVTAVNNHDALLCVVRQMIEAVDSGNLQMSSPEIGEPENNIPIHQWHEEFLHYAREALRAVVEEGRQP